MINSTLQNLSAAAPKISTDSVVNASQSGGWTTSQQIQIVLALGSIAFQVFAIIIVIAIASESVGKSRTNARIKKNLWKRWIVTAFVVLSITCASVLLYAWTGKSDFASGTFIGLVGFILSWVVSADSFFQKRRVILMGKSRNNFVISVLGASRRRLESEKGLVVSELYIAHGDPYTESVDQQIALLRSDAVRNCDALIIMPAEINDSLSTELLHLNERGVLVVLCDQKPGDDVFFSRNILPPCFVGSDSTLGGKILADHIRNDSDIDLAIIFTGPPKSIPGISRSKSLIDNIRSFNNIHKVIEIALEDWTPKKAKDQLNLEFEKILFEDSKQYNITVFGGNDELTTHLARFTRGLVPAKGTSCWKFYGYDGLRDLADRPFLSDVPEVHATVDQQPFEIGITAADFVLDQYHGRVNQWCRRVLIPPKLLMMDQN